MRIPSIFACLTALSLSPFAFGAVNFFEGFENPAIPGPDPYLAIPSGPQILDNPGWVVINTADPDFGVYVTTLPDLSMGTGQALVFGGGQAPAPNSVSILVSGFTGMQLATIKFDHRADFTEVQTTTVTVRDYSNGNILYTKVAVGNGSVDESFSANPVGDTVEVTIEQSGSTLNSDASVDNLMITAIPEPSLTLLGALGALIGLSRRRR